MTTKSTTKKTIRKRKKPAMGFRERIIKLLGGVPAPKKRTGAVSVRPYTRKKAAPPDKGAGESTSSAPNDGNRADDARQESMAMEQGNENL